MIRSICCWGAGSSSMKPERVRGVILAIANAPFRVMRASGPRLPPARRRGRGRRKKYAPVPRLWDESACRFVVPPKFKAPGEPPLASCGAGRGRGRLRPRSAAVLPPLRPERSQRRVPLCGAGGLEYCCGIRAVQMNQQGDCMRFGEKCQAMGRLEGLTMQRQSRSPRARPSTSISAVAMLLAKGMLFWSHRREI